MTLDRRGMWSPQSAELGPVLAELGGWVSHSQCPTLAVDK